MPVTLRPLILIAVLILGISLLQFILSITPPKFSGAATPADYNWEYEHVSFTTDDGKTLQGWFIPAANKTDRTIVVGHGYPADKNTVLPVARFLHDNYNLLFFDFRSFGESEGLVTTGGYREQEDVKAAVTYLKEHHPGKAERIGGYGFSMSAATFLMQHEKFDAVVAEAPYADLGQMINQLYFYLGPLKHVFALPTKLYAKLLFGVWPGNISPATDMQDSTTPVLLIHGADDREIPASHSEEIMETAPENTTELWIVEGGGHGTVHAAAGKTYEDRISRFFQQNLK